MQATLTKLTALEIQRRERAAQPIPHTMMRRPLCVTDIMRRAERLFPEQQVVSRHGPGRIVRQTYRELGENARRLASLLAAKGIEPGMRVATLMWNHGVHLAAYYAVPAVRAVLHPLNPRLSPQELAYIVADAGDACILVDDDLLPLWQEVQQHVQLPTVLVHALGERPSAQALASGYPLLADELAAVEPLAEWPQDEVDENDAVSICYTSGTTGRSKGVVYTHRSILLHGVSLSTPDALALSGRDVALTITPMFHVNAWSMPYTAVLFGMRQVLCGPRPSPAEIADLMVDEGVSLALAVPTVWNDFLNAVENEPGRWTFRPGARISSGGSAPPPEMFRRFDRLGMQLQTGWGMTEVSPMGSLTWIKPELQAQLSPQALLELRTSNGLPLPFVEMRHVDDQGRVLPWDGVARGELQVRGPWVTGAYIGYPECLKATSDDGWLLTGDIVVFRPDGYMQLVDRKKDLVKSGGEWISSIEVENALQDHPAVAEAAVIAVPDPRWSERPLAAIAVKPDAQVSAEELREHLLKRFPKWMVPEQIEFLDRLPKTSVGKLNKIELRRQFA